MFQKARLRKVHAQFLESCRNLEEGRDYWGKIGPIRKWFLQTIIPVPLLGLHQDGALLLGALQWLEEHCREEPVSEGLIRRYHAMVYQGQEKLGEYRKGPIAVKGSMIPRCPPEKIKLRMTQLSMKLIIEQREIENNPDLDKDLILRCALHTYERIGLIHPFEDANGRVARLSANHLLRRYGLGYLIFPPLSEAPDLMEALQLAHKGDMEGLLELAKKLLFSA